MLFSEMDAGHFVSRNHLATRWNEQNVNAQCRKCNRFSSGNQYEHGLAIDRKYGKGTAEKLLIMSKQKCKLSEFEMRILIGEYKKKVKAMKA
jgi:hypothetical protein